ncbi:MAG: flagellar biosynthetic protein FliR [Nitrospira sp.]|nr:flagellar biosynthetic protein FliR [Nitrospira sp.]
MLNFEFAVQELWSFIVVLVRTAAILSAMPLLGSGNVPLRIKVTMAAGIAILLTPVVSLHFEPNWLQPFTLLMGLIAEVFVGITLGLGTRLLMAAVELAGQIMGFQVGFGFAQAVDPATQLQTPVFGQLLTVFATLLYFQVNGHHLILLALGSSFKLIPPFGASLHAPLLADITQLIQEMMHTGLQLALPVIAVTFVIHLTMGILGRLVPQMNVLVTSFPITISMGLLVLGFGLPLMAMIFQESIMGLEAIVWDILRELGRG